uniref:Uncharacterized protein n=1 Tax=Romanomermis culicivorax TaxID=13658 RepID=A0A915JDP7_ROMCU
MGAALLFGQLLMVFTLTAFTLHKYGNWRKQNPLVTISTLISWYFAFIIIFLIPLDVVMTFYLQCRKTMDSGNGTKIANISLNTSSLIETLLSNIDVCKKPSSFISRNALINLWEFVYWTSQLLTWLVTSNL